MMRKGQIFGEMFKYIFIAIVAVLVLVFGIRIVSELRDTGEDLTEKVFFEDIEKKFNTVYSDSYGSVVSLENVQVPKTMKEICFVDYNNPFNLEGIENKNMELAIEGSYSIDDDKNIFTLGSTLDKRKAVKELILNSFVLCDSLEDSVVNIKLTNSGQKIKAEAI
jgi:hypothetical protein